VLSPTPLQIVGVVTKIGLLILFGLLLFPFRVISTKEVSQLKSVWRRVADKKPED
jgi:hypothetical protein